MRESQIFLRLLGRALGRDGELPTALAPETLARLLRVAKDQDVTGLLAEGILCTELALPDEVQQALFLRTGVELRHFEMQHRALDTLLAAFEQAALDHLPLKGAVLCALYPRPELRIGRDVDILVREQDLERAVAIAAEVFGVKPSLRGTHDVSFVTAEGVRFELHFALTDDADRAPTALVSVWEHAKPCAAGGCCYCLTDDVQLCYLLTHMARHLRASGCGVRPLLDVYLLSRKHPEAVEGACILLEEAGLSGFARRILADADTLLGEAEPDAALIELADFLVYNGAFGSFQSAAARAELKGARKRPIRHFLSRVFLPYRNMVYHYPILCKLPFLLPLCWGLRGLRVLRRADRARFLASNRANAALSAEQVAALQRVSDRLQL